MGGDEGRVKEPGVGVRVQDKADRVPCIPQSLAPTSQDETVRSEYGGIERKGASRSVGSPVRPPVRRITESHVGTRAGQAPESGCTRSSLREVQGGRRQAPDSWSPVAPDAPAISPESTCHRPHCGQSHTHLCWC